MKIFQCSSSVEFRMLQEQQPFKFTFWLTQCYGFWKTEGHSKYRKFFSVFMFLWLHPVAIVYLTMSLLQVDDVSDSARSIFFMCVTITAFGYDGSFIAFSRQIEDLTQDISRVFSEKPEAEKLLIKTCQKIFQDKMKKYAVLTICVALGMFLPFLTGKLTSPIFTPSSLKNSRGYFYFSWFYESVEMIYLATISTLCQDLFLELLFIIQTYTKFFKSQIKTVDLSGIDGKFKLIECIKLHQNVKR